jgi:hypothetical protein
MMLSFIDIPIQRKIRLAILLASVVTLFLASVALVGWQWDDARDRTRGFLKTEAEILADNSAAALMFQDRAGAEQVLASLRAQPHVLGAELHGMDGRVFARFGAAGAMDAWPVSLPPEGFAREGKVLELVQVVLEEGRRIGHLRLRYDFAALEWEILRPLIWIVGVVFVAVAAVDSPADPAPDLGGPSGGGAEGLLGPGAGDGRGRSRDARPRLQPDVGADP